MCEFLIFNTHKRYEKQKKFGNFSETFWQHLDTLSATFLGFIGNLWLSLVEGDAVTKLQRFVWLFNHVSRVIT